MNKASDGTTVVTRLGRDSSSDARQIIKVQTTLHDITRNGVCVVRLDQVTPSSDRAARVETTAQGKASDLEQERSADAISGKLIAIIIQRGAGRLRETGGKRGKARERKQYS